MYSTDNFNTVLDAKNYKIGKKLFCTWYLILYIQTVTIVLDHYNLESTSSKSLILKQINIQWTNL